MSERTPGPWVVERYVVDANEVEVSGSSRGDLRERRRIVASECGDSSTGPIVADIVFGGAADACLIAAAPDMYELLQLAVEKCSEDDEVWLSHSWVKNAIATIAKAQGKP